MSNEFYDKLKLVREQITDETYDEFDDVIEASIFASFSFCCKAPIDDDGRCTECKEICIPMSEQELSEYQDPYPELFE